MPCYSGILDLTFYAINKRASNHRNMVIATCCVFVLALIMSIANNALIHQSILVLLLPVSSLFFYLDSKIMQAWQEDVLNKWSSSKIELEIFKDTLLQLPHLPENTISGMLSTLPDCGGASNEIQLSLESRELISRLVLVVNSMRGILLLLRSATSTAIAGSIIFAIYTHSWIPLVGCIAIVLYPLAKGMWIRHSSRRIAGELRDLIKSEQIDAERVQECLGRYDWAPFLGVKLTPLELIVRN